jgi:hypothetical protein
MRRRSKEAEHVADLQIYEILTNAILGMMNAARTAALEAVDELRLEEPRPWWRYMTVEERRTFDKLKQVQSGLAYRLGFREPTPPRPPLKRTRPPRIIGLNEMTPESWTPGELRFDNHHPPDQPGDIMCICSRCDPRVMPDWRLLPDIKL